MCVAESGLEIGRVEFTGVAGGDGVQATYHVYPASYNNYAVSEIYLYMGPEQNPFNADGTLKPTVSAANFVSKTYDPAVKRTEDFVMDFDGALEDWVYIIPYAKVTMVE